MGPALPAPQGLPLGGRAVHAPPDVQRTAAPGQEPLRPQLAAGKAVTSETAVRNIALRCRARRGA